MSERNLKPKPHDPDFTPTTTTTTTYINKLINNNNNNKQSSDKILRTYSISRVLARTFKLYCTFLNVNMSESVEIAIMDFMKKHIDQIPVDATFTLVPQAEVHAKTELCGFKGCSEPSVAYGIWLPKDERYALCKKHLVEAKANLKNWKVTV